MKKVFGLFLIFVAIFSFSLSAEAQSYNLDFGNNFEDFVYIGSQEYERFDESNDIGVLSRGVDLYEGESLTIVLGVVNERHFESWLPEDIASTQVRSAAYWRQSFNESDFRFQTVNGDNERIEGFDESVSVSNAQINLLDIDETSYEEPVPIATITVTIDIPEGYNGKYAFVNSEGRRDIIETGFISERNSSFSWGNDEERYVPHEKYLLGEDDLFADEIKPFESLEMGPNEDYIYYHYRISRTALEDGVAQRTVILEGLGENSENEYESGFIFNLWDIARDNHLNNVTKNQFESTSRDVFDEGFLVIPVGFNSFVDDGVGYDRFYNKNDDVLFSRDQFQNTKDFSEDLGGEIFLSDYNQSGTMFYGFIDSENDFVNFEDETFGRPFDIREFNFDGETFKSEDGWGDFNMLQFSSRGVQDLIESGSEINFYYEESKTFFQRSSDDLTGLRLDFGGTYNMQDDRAQTEEPSISFENLKINGGDEFIIGFYKSVSDGPDENLGNHTLSIQEGEEETLTVGFSEIDENWEDWDSSYASISFNTIDSDQTESFEVQEINFDNFELTHIRPSGSMALLDFSNDFRYGLNDSERERGFWETFGVESHEITLKETFNFKENEFEEGELLKNVYVQEIMEKGTPYGFGFTIRTPIGSQYPEDFDVDVNFRTGELETELFFEERGLKRDVIYSTINENSESSSEFHFITAKDSVEKSFENEVGRRETLNSFKFNFDNVFYDYVSGGDFLPFGLDSDLNRVLEVDGLLKTQSGSIDFFNPEEDGAYVFGFEFQTDIGNYYSVHDNFGVGNVSRPGQDDESLSFIFDFLDGTFGIQEDRDFAVFVSIVTLFLMSLLAFSKISFVINLVLSGSVFVVLSFLFDVPLIFWIIGVMAFIAAFIFFKN